ncbi:hypothetical protein AB0368_00165 [Actinoplanes sp. NPDC051475]|uniref:hypothetical protein n=1 Tax=Actinoplanes sp. NPDC051475 TaxID=3157225 RepID=UPI00344C94BF
MNRPVGDGESTRPPAAQQAGPATSGLGQQAPTPSGLGQQGAAPSGSGQQGGAPSGLGLGEGESASSQPAPRAKRPPLEPPDMGQLNRPAEGAPAEPTGASTGQPQRPAAGGDAPRTVPGWDPPKNDGETPSGLPSRPQQ